MVWNYGTVPWMVFDADLIGWLAFWGMCLLLRQWMNADGTWEMR